MNQYTESIRAKLYRYFNQRLNLKKSTKGYFRAECPWCGGNYTFGINFTDSKAHCFKCEEKKNPIALLMELEGFSRKQEAYKFLSIQEEYDLYDGRSNTRKVEYDPIALPDGYTPINMGDSRLAKAARHYLSSKRGFKIKKLAEKGVGFCETGQYAGYIVFPIYQRGELVFFQTRIFAGSGPKMKNPEEEKFGVGKSQILYNADALYIYKVCVIVESITNAETRGDRAVAMLGKSASQKQLSQLISAPCEEYVIFLDRDAANKAIELAMQLVHYKKIKIVIPPTDDDINAMGKKKAMELERAAKYCTYGDLYRMKLNHATETERSYN